MLEASSLDDSAGGEPSGSLSEEDSVPKEYTRLTGDGQRSADTAAGDEDVDAMTSESLYDASYSSDGDRAYVGKGSAEYDESWADGQVVRDSCVLLSIVGESAISASVYSAEIESGE